MQHNRHKLNIREADPPDLKFGDLNEGDIFCLTQAQDVDALAQVYMLYLESSGQVGAINLRTGLRAPLPYNTPISKFRSGTEILLTVR